MGDCPGLSNRLLFSFNAHCGAVAKAANRNCEYVSWSRWNKREDAEKSAKHQEGNTKG